MQTIQLTLPTQSYEIHVELGLLAGAGEIVSSVAPSGRAMLVVDSNITDGHRREVKKSLVEADYDVFEHGLVADERLKTLDTVRGIYKGMLAFRLDRTCPVIALGGGVVGDIAGFAAATFLRGLPFIQVPTTLLAMVDASIGGKTGVNFPLPADGEGRQELGKNLVGAFWQPRAVITDPEVLKTLDPRHFRCGLAECIKHGVIGDPELLTFIGSNAQDIAELEQGAIEELITRSARLKVNVVEEDEREAGRRALLNLGHTFAHVIEPLEELELRHGEAVAIGLCAAASCSVQTDRLSQEDAEKLVELIDHAGLPTKLRRAEDLGRLIRAMGYDKKVAGGRLRLVLPTSLGSAEIVDDVPRAAIETAWRAVGADG